MDFADFDLRTASEAGTWVHLAHGGQPLFAQADKSIGPVETDKPCRVHLRGIMAPGVYELIQRVQMMDQALKARLSRATDKDIEAIIQKHEAQAQVVMADLVVAAVSGWENIVMAGKQAEMTRDALLHVCGPKAAFFGQVFEALMERHDFFKRAANG